MTNALKCHLLALAFAAAGAGCASPQPLSVWQQRLTDYIFVQGDGDPNILREAPSLRSSRGLRPAEIRFSMTDLNGPGLPPFVSTLDVHGVLVGQGVSGAERVFVFLVGINERTVGGTWQIGDLRAVTMTLQGRRLVWRSTEPDAGALDRYLAGRSTAGGTRLPGHAVHETFPALDDAFRLELREDFAAVRDVHSAATWKVPLKDIRRSGRGNVNTLSTPAAAPGPRKPPTPARESVAVGTALSGGPPRRSVRAELPHMGLTSGAWSRSGRWDLDARPGAGVSNARRAARGQPPEQAVS